MKKGKEIEEKTCVESFLNWYNKRHNRNYTYEKATDHFPELNNNKQGDWDFVVYERDNPEGWIGIEVKELRPLRKETSVSFTFWERLCSDLTKDLPGKGIKGQFEISLPPVLDLAKKERPRRLVKAISEVLVHKQSGWKIRESKDIGPDVASKFPSWPKQRSDVNEWDEYGTYRPCKLEITKVSDSGWGVTVVRILGNGNVVEEDKKAFNSVFKLKNGVIQPDRQLKLAKEKGARKTILLLADMGVDEENTRNSVQNCLDHHLISHIDCIYLVDMGNEDRLVKMHPS